MYSDSEDRAQKKTRKNDLRQGSHSHNGWLGHVTKSNRHSVGTNGSESSDSSTGCHPNYSSGSQSITNDSNLSWDTCFELCHSCPEHDDVLQPFTNKTWTTLHKAAATQRDATYFFLQDNNAIDKNGSLCQLKSISNAIKHTQAQRYWQQLKNKHKLSLNLPT